MSRKKKMGRQKCVGEDSKSASSATVISHLAFYTAMVIVVAIPIIATFRYGVRGFGVAVLINLITLPFTVPSLKDASPIRESGFSSSILRLIRTRGFSIIFFSVLNLFVFLKFGLQTLISTWMLLLLYVAVMGFVFITKRKRSREFKTYLVSFCIAPLFLNTLLLVNFLFSVNPVNETYAFQNDIQPSGGKRGPKRYIESTYVYLENGAYSAYPGIRAFFDYDRMKGNKHITYTFKDGILGFRVMTDYEFNP